MPIGSRIMGLRQPGENNQPFARRLGVSHGTLLNISRGAFPRVSTIEHVANRLGLVPAWILWGTGPRTVEEAEAVEEFLEEYRDQNGREELQEGLQEQDKRHEDRT